MYKSKGQEALEFVLVTVLVFFGALLAIFVFGDKIAQFFSLNSTNAAANNTSKAMIKADANGRYYSENFGSLPANNPNKGQISETPENSGGQPESPVSTCSNGVCSIDFGSFILNGVPENFDDFVKSSGTSGGIDKMIALLLQLADQQEQQGDAAGATELRELANTGHNISGYFKQCEDNVQAGFTDFVGGAVFTDQTGKQYDISQAQDGIARIGHIRNKMMTDPSFNIETQKDSKPAAKFVYLYDKVAANPKFSGQVKDIVKELYSAIGSLSEETSSMIHVAGGGMQTPEYDPLTGSALPLKNLSGITMQSILHPQTSSVNNFKSALICITGKNQDSGTNCR